MRDQHYKNKTLRIADATWEKLKDKRRKSGMSWNLFILSLVKGKKVSTKKTELPEGVPPSPREVEKKTGTTQSHLSQKQL